MPTFKATVDFRFEAESIEQAGAELRKLQDAVRGIGFTDITGQVMLDEDDEPDSGDTWKGYGPTVHE